MSKEKPELGGWGGGGKMPLLRNIEASDIDDLLNQPGSPRRRRRAFFLSGIYVCVFVGLVLAVLMAGVYHYSGSSEFCGACHSMETVHTQWRVSRHKQFACTECHLPDSNLAGKFIYKARAGMKDLWHETVRSYPAMIRLSQEGNVIANGNCRRCHYSTIENTAMVEGDTNCLKCHNGLVHGRGIKREVLLYE